ncbi:ABC transporter ATP-binding protein [Devosia sp. YIM 151766]|uniref:ABC transporter ATP-binding protein n=1 Tax=Devosia sp. YIM 151766 TaxID=3017325 RepID=UPI00255C6141|nr:ABC transporter ATP-binding protein [Devosia sp. YIM 151766]WIY52742.1 ABC transporter ATP-binding protein [Devosia sp. YIM 151766]
MQTPILRITDLETSFHQDEGVIKALDGVNLEVYAGKTLGIVGESGCGKSVTARSILRILDKSASIDNGQIWLDDGVDAAAVDLVGLPAEGSQIRSIRGGRIALIFQEPMTSLSPLYTIGSQIIEVILKHRNVTKREAREMAIHYMNEVGIPQPSSRIDSYSFQLSGGLRQRVVIAMALAGDPRVLIADEPTTALDVTTQAQILDLLQRIQQENNLALILITHDMGVVAEMCDDVAVMYLGRVVEHAPVRTIFQSPQHPYTRLLLRSIPDIRAAPKSKLPTIEGSVPHPYMRPQGCLFHPRCPIAESGLCDVEVPKEVHLPMGSRVSCFRTGIPL